MLSPVITSLEFKVSVTLVLPSYTLLAAEADTVIALVVTVCVPTATAVLKLSPVWVRLV